MDIKNIKIDLIPILLSLKLAIITSLILIIIGIPIAWWLSRTKKKSLKNIIETLVCLPLVLPPTVIGFYILIFINPQTYIEILWKKIFNYDVLFSMTGLIIGSIIYSLPFAIQPLQISFEKIKNTTLEQTKIIQLSKIKTIKKIILPLSKNGLIKAFILSFAHTLGEFGVVLMIGGNIPGKTQVLSIAIYEKIEMLDYTYTHILSILTLLISFFILIILSYLNKKE